MEILNNTVTLFKTATIHYSDFVIRMKPIKLTVTIRMMYMSHGEFKCQDFHHM
jgi:hypothetical protein